MPPELQQSVLSPGSHGVLTRTPYWALKPSRSFQKIPQNRPPAPRGTSPESVMPATMELRLPLTLVGDAHVDEGFGMDLYPYSLGEARRRFQAGPTGAEKPLGSASLRNRAN